ncbi:hypothetical protein CLD22_29160, partial [Rubrivivax gelatinosus]|nr:hypothetical protein [Rubrivivax gelatinosus]
RQGHPGTAPRTLMRQLLPGMVLALATSVLAYAALAIAPFPGLRQMALFSATGLVAAFLTVACWYPLLDRSPVRASRFAERIAASLAPWPRFRRSRRLAVVGLATALLVGVGLARLQPGDDLRQLQGSPAPLIQAQREVGRLLGLPSPAQFFLVQAVSASSRCSSSSALSAHVESSVLAGVNTALGESLQRPGFAAAPLTLERWLASPVSAAARALWLGDTMGRPT